MEIQDKNRIKIILKTISYTMLTIILIGLLGFGFALYDKIRIKEIDLSLLSEINSEDGAKLNIDTNNYVERGNEATLNISGWAILKGKKTQPSAITVAIQNESTGEVFLLPTQKVTRTDVTKYFQKDHINYDDSGFTVHYRLNYDKSIDFRSCNYRIIILCTIEDKMYILKQQENEYSYIDKSTEYDAEIIFYD